MLSDVKVFASDAPSAPLVVLHCYGDEGGQVYSAVKEITDSDFSLAAVSGLDWNKDMSPWSAKSVFKGEKDFEGGADRYIEELEGKILPDTLSRLSGEPSAKYIAGYSMAGLFSLYSLYKTDIFDGAASCSGSLWYPDFREYCEARELKQGTRIYMSLGDKESHTRNPVMATVEDNTKAIYEMYRSKGIDTLFEMNQGNHFTEPDKRTAKGIAWLIGGY